jgi:hypothetical protein
MGTGSSISNINRRRLQAGMITAKAKLGGLSVVAFYGFIVAAALVAGMMRIWMK